MRLGSEEHIKDTVYAFPVDAPSGICHCYPHAGRYDRGLYMQHSLPVGHGTHCLNGIHDQVSEDQLQLNSVAYHGGKRVDQFSPNRDSSVLNLSSRQQEDLSNKFVDVKRSPSLLTLPENCTNALDSVVGTMSVLHDLIQSFPRFVEVRRRTCKPAQARIAVRHDRG